MYVDFRTAYTRCFADLTQVSDVYVRLGDIFDTCITSFNRAGISTR